MNLLIVEDEAKLSSLMQEHLSGQFDLEFRDSYERFEEAIAQPSLSAEVLVLDRMMDGKDTIQLLSKFKERFPHTRILVLSAIDTPGEKAWAIDHGADDYLAKPFAWEELSARIRSLMRTSVRELRFANVVVDKVDWEVRVDGREVSLSNKEYLLLRVFMRSPGQVFTKQKLVEEVWKMSTEVESNTLETTLTKLRKKLAEAGAAMQIRNSRSLGYWLEE